MLDRNVKILNKNKTVDQTAGGVITNICVAMFRQFRSTTITRFAFTPLLSCVRNIHAISAGKSLILEQDELGWRSLSANYSQLSKLLRLAHLEDQSSSVAVLRETLR